MHTVFSSHLVRYFSAVDLPSQVYSMVFFQVLFHLLGPFGLRTTEFVAKFEFVQVCSYV